jgi:hypothetical protein
MSEYKFPANIMEIQKKFLNLPQDALNECINRIQNRETALSDVRINKLIPTVLPPADLSVLSPADLKKSFEKLWRVLIWYESGMRLIQQVVGSYFQE